jgi:RNA polymerase sigma-70 factor, ECF subfamily
MAAQEGRSRKSNPIISDELNEDLVRHLVYRFKAGDGQAFSEIVRLYRKQVAALAYRIVGDYDEAADITQAVFLKMAGNVWRYDHHKKFYTWLYRITVNASIDHLRKHRRHKHEPLDSFSESLETPGSNPEHLLRQKQLSGYITEAAQTLNDKQRSAFILRDVEGCQVDDVAQIMNMPEATVRWYLHRARTRIKKELLRRCPQLVFSFGLR